MRINEKRVGKIKALGPCHLIEAKEPHEGTRKIADVTPETAAA
jgi:hypothetical protein